MTQTYVIELGRHAIEVMLIASAPFLLLSLLVGIGVGLLQALTQMNDPSISFVPKILALALGFLLFLPWSLQLLVDYMTTLITSIPSIAH